MAELLDRIHAEIRERMDANRAAVREYELLEAALGALGTPAPAPRKRRAPAPRPALRALDHAPEPEPEPRPAAAPEAEAEPAEIAAAA